MSLEFDILKKSLEAEISYNDGTKPMIEFLVFGIVAIFLIPKKNDDFLIIKLIIATFIIIIVLNKTSNSKPASELIEENLIGKLVVITKPFEIKDNLGHLLVDNKFNGKIILKYEGYNTEIVRYSRNSIIYYGTKNKIIIKDANVEKKFIIYLKGTAGKRKFEKLAEILFNNGIDVEEYKRGERTYLGKKLSYKEIQEFKKRKNNR